MEKYRLGSLSWHIARLWEKRRQLECGTTFYGWPEASAGHYANIAAEEITAIDAEFAEAVKLLREFGVVVPAELDEAAVENRTLGANIQPKR